MIPPEIFTYWHQGFGAAPVIPANCLDQIRRSHSNCTIHALDSSHIREIREDIPISEVVWRKLRLPHQSDLIRTALLIKHGGVWIDPTVFPMVNTWDWLQDRMGAGLFVFQRPGRDRLLSNWFIAAQPGHPILVELLEKLCAYYQTQDWDFQSVRSDWSFDKIARLINRHPSLTRLWFRKSLRLFVRQPPYLIYHYAVYDLLCGKPHLGCLWNEMPVVSAQPSHALQRIGLQKPICADARALIEGPEVPVFKLTWKLPKPEVADGSVLQYLFEHG
jgi:hypothetical protein